ncbi:MAG: SDR family oxidoreductase [Chloroflexota bacterium]|nr:SDR family oxidoreductase [Chloroflexota bacterium]
MFRDDLLAEKVVLVTGGGSGLGLSMAKRFASLGARVAITGRSEERLNGAAAEIDPTGERVFVVPCDVRDFAQVEAMVGSVVGKWGGIDVLVNNAGIYPNTLVVDMTEDEWDAVFDTNVKGMFLVSRAVAQRMIERGAGGRIVNISSGAAESGRVGAAHYCASKAAVNMFTRVLALELASHDIVVNAVGPGLIEVPDWSLSDEYVSALVSSNPLGRMGQPEDVARAVLYLASPEATYITGTTLYVDGGSLAGRPLPPSG